MTTRVDQLHSGMRRDGFVCNMHAVPVQVLLGVMSSRHGWPAVCLRVSAHYRPCPGTCAWIVTMTSGVWQLPAHDSPPRYVLDDL